MSTSGNPTVVLFRNDLRVNDHPALAAAVRRGAIVPLYVLDDRAPGDWRMGGASRWWLLHSLSALATALERAGAPLVLRRGDTVETVMDIVARTNADAVHVSRAFEPWAARLEQKLRDELESNGVDLKRFGGTLLHDPDEIRTQAGEPYKVYSPFWRVLAKSDIRQPGKAAAIDQKPVADVASDALESWDLLPTKPNWAAAFDEHWSPGEEGARTRLEEFLDDAVRDYASERDRPDLHATSRLSPHLHFGEISPATCWFAARSAAEAEPGLAKGVEKFVKELAWRDFSYHLLHNWPDLPEQPFRPEFGEFPWTEPDERLRLWQQGRTGFPIVDAGMRELWATGWMHNRVRMIVASFLIKDLLIHWLHGEAWFWDCLVDADLASNAASWQWVAGSGADAAPYFRIFNPTTQSRKFDPNGEYIRRWVPELAQLSTDALHAPSEADEATLSDAGVTLGETYPEPIVDHARARNRALEHYEAIRKS